ncbi:uncharacterized protein [Choristoneura fumiferana]|uniref:uncharacterized protein n=1 Tax=Choristoneura fumiferana TaxID=7141 RepID=UPI003D15650A
MEQDVPNDEALPPPPAPLPSASLPPPPIEIEKEFILAFESLPELWDKTHTFYINKYKRNDALRKLLNIYIKIKPGATIEDVKKKKNVLRSNYRRELKKIISSRRSGSSTDDLYRPKSWTFEYLKFLDKFEQPVPVDRASDDNQNEAESDQAQKEQEVAATISSFVAAPQPPARPPPLSSKKSVLKTQNELLERACNYLSEPQVSGARSIAFDWAETLERLTPTQRLYAKKAINDVLFEAELGNLHRYSVQINVTSTPSPAPSPFCPFPPESSSYSHTTSLEYIQSPVTASPAQSPNYIQTPVTAPPAHSSNNIQTQARAKTANIQLVRYSLNLKRNNNMMIKLVT